MAETFGSRAKSKFKLPSVDSTQTYYILVEENGDSILKRINPFVQDSKIPGFAEAQDTTVGTIPSTGPNKGKLVPNTGIFGVGGATENEIRAFAQQPQNIKKVKEQAEIVAKKGIFATGKTAQESQTAASNLLETGKQQNPETGDETGGTVANESTVTPGINRIADLNNSPDIKTKGRSVKDYPENNLLRYPLKRDGKQDCVSFTMLEYAPKKFSTTAADFRKGEAQSKRLNPSSEVRRGKTVTLPIQPTISDMNTVRWGAEDMNALQAVAAAAAMSTIKGGPEAAAAAVTGVGEFISGNNESIKALITAGFAGQAAQVQGLLTRATGGILNPNMELLFQGPDLRTFNYNFSLSARSREEAKVIRNIIRFFKQGMSVKRANTALFLKSPHTFQIRYHFEGNLEKDHPWINRIGECALTNCAVNYTPGGNYATFSDGAMTQYDISLSFSELEPIYDDDYENSGGTGNESEIGY